MTEIEQILGGLEPLVHDYGVVAVTVILTFESFGVPLPGESLLIFAAVLAGRGEISFPWLLLSAWAGAVLGDNIGYVIGRVMGRAVLLRYGGKIGLNADRLHQIEAVFARYGPLTVGFARFFNILRQLNGVVAGTLNMDWRQFLVFNALGGAVWVLVWSFAGFFLGRHVSNIVTIAESLGLIGAVFLALLVIALAYVAWHRRG